MNRDVLAMQLAEARVEIANAKAECAALRRDKEVLVGVITTAVHMQ